MRSCILVLCATLLSACSSGTNVAESTTTSVAAPPSSSPLVDVASSFNRALDEAARSGTEPVTIAALQAAFAPSGTVLAEDSDGDGRDDDAKVTVQLHTKEWCLSIPDVAKGIAAQTESGPCQ